MDKFRVSMVQYDMDKTKNRKRKNLLVDGRSEKEVISKLEKIHKGEKVVIIHEIVWDEVQIAESVANEELRQTRLFTGEVKFFNDEKGFGMIIPDENLADVFFHKTAVVGPDLREMDEVEFEISESPKGPCAIRIKLI